MNFLTIEELLECKKVPEKWNNWRWQMEQRTTCSRISSLVGLGLVSNEQSKKVSSRLGLTPYNVELLLRLQKEDVRAYDAELLQSVLFSGKTDEKHLWVWARYAKFDSSGYLGQFPALLRLRNYFMGEGSNTSVQCLENFYPRTDVLIVTAVCARNCSHCFREVGDSDGEASGNAGGMRVVLETVQSILNRKTPHVLITGGDPLTRSNEQLRSILLPLVESDTVQVLRLATRMVVDLPMRFYDEDLLEMLREFADKMRERGANLYLVTQINHPCELTSEALIALSNIKKCDIQILNQTVLLRGVNDDENILRDLFLTLDRLNVRSYKLFHPMPVSGTENLRVSIRRFRQLLALLHQWIPGTCVPQANVNTMAGKIPVSPSGRWVFLIPFTKFALCRNFQGKLVFFKDVWDWLRFGRECVTLALIIAFCINVMSYTPFTEEVISARSSLHIEKVAYVDDLYTYVEGYMRLTFQPFVVGNVLYIPYQMSIKEVSETLGII